MTVYEIFTLIHVAFTIIALVTGIIAMVAIPKGSNLHKKSGLVYFYAFIGVALFAFLMLTIKYKHFFLAVTLFETYLIVMGYRAVQFKGEKASFMDWFMLIILFCTGILFLYSALIIYDIFFGVEYGWGVIRIFYALLVFYIFIVDLQYLRNKTNDKKMWRLNHMEKMLISYIALISGVLLRYSEYFLSKDLKWTFWITPYLFCLPLVAFWISKYKPKTTKQK